MSKKNIIRLTESELKKVITESVKNVLKEEEINELQFETITHIRDLYTIATMAHRIRGGFRTYIYGNMTYDGGYVKGLQDNKLTPSIQKLVDAALDVEHIAQERLEEYDEEVVRKVIKMTDPDVLQGYL